MLLKIHQYWEHLKCVNLFFPSALTQCVREDMHLARSASNNEHLARTTNFIFAKLGWY